MTDTIAGLLAASFKTAPLYSLLNFQYKIAPNTILYDLPLLSNKPFLYLSF